MRTFLHLLVFIGPISIVALFMNCHSPKPHVRYLSGGEDSTAFIFDSSVIHIGGEITSITGTTTITPCYTKHQLDSAYRAGVKEGKKIVTTNIDHVNTLIQ